MILIKVVNISVHYILGYIFLQLLLSLLSWQHILSKQYNNEANKLGM